MSFVSFEIPGEPLAFARAGSNGARRFTPAPQARFMDAIRLVARSRMRGSAPLEGPLQMQIRAVYVAPASWSAKRKAGTIWKTSTPDADNLAKIVKDALNKIVYGDDAQVADLRVQKVYGPAPGLIVSVQAIGGEDG